MENFLVNFDLKFLLYLLYVVGASGVAKFFDTMRKQFSEEEWRIIKSPTEDTEQLKLFFRHWVLILIFLVTFIALNNLQPQGFF